MPDFPVDLAELRCPDCGTTFLDFRRTGKLGCPYDYVVFRDGLIPLLDRVQRSQHHTGKKPLRASEVVEAHSPVRALRFQLRQAIESEEYQQAAKIRDLIRAREKQNGSE
ncbi:UvrB/UvrC motif-containing protein [bacterium]|jgi:protein arginine kinase activator|nr:UvrB/UvrC motif-containing protein [bacterium]